MYQQGRVWGAIRAKGATSPHVHREALRGPEVEFDFISSVSLSESGHFLDQVNILREFSR